jgi:hypothetical protein
MENKRSKFSPNWCAALVACAVGAPLFVQPSFSEDSDQSVQARTITHRITPSQYRNIITDVFGSHIDLGGRFEPDLRKEGLLAVGSGLVSVTASGMEQYDAMSRAIAEKVVDEAHRELLIPCGPASPAEADDSCAEAFFTEAGLLLYRRPLTANQLNAYVSAARTGAQHTNDFYEGLSLSLAGMLSSPSFLFREQRAEPDPSAPGDYRLDSFTKAAQLSFFLWNAGPDRQLLAAAANGDLHTEEGLTRQADRMLASSRLEAGLRAFFNDNFRFDEFETLAKDSIIFPKYSPAISEQAREQTIRTVLDVVLARRADYREVFTTKRTFLTPELGSIYRVPVFKSGPNGSPDDWQSYEFAESDPYQGILTQIAFTALHSPAGRSSPTFRGKALREIMMCQKVPAPPGDVDFTLFEGEDLRKATARVRLKAHSSEPMCAGCHKITDPIGLALENFDGAGEYRTTDNDAVIDPSGVLNGSNFSDVKEFTEVVYNDTVTTSCLVERMSSYALGRGPVPMEKAWIETLDKSFTESGYKVMNLMREIALSDALHKLPTVELNTASNSVN